MRRWLRMLLMLLFALLGIGLVLWVGGMAREDASAVRDTPPDAGMVPTEAAAQGEDPSTVPTGELLDYRILDGGHRVEGRFGLVHFQAEAVGTEGAQARYWLDDAADADDAELAVTITTRLQGEVTWAGRRFDGQGALAGNDVAALESLAGGRLAQALARIPLDLACRPDADPVPAAVGAALLMPWQLLLKYAIDQPADAARSQALQSECGYFGHRTAAGALPTAHPHLLLLGHEQQIPMALPYLPLDGAGQRGGPR